MMRRRLHNEDSKLTLKCVEVEKNRTKRGQSRVSTRNIWWQASLCLSVFVLVRLSLQIDDEDGFSTSFTPKKNFPAIRLSAEFLHLSAPPFSLLDFGDSSPNRAERPDYGGLSIYYPGKVKRRIHPNDMGILEDERVEALNDSRFRFVPEQYQNDEDLESGKCKRNSWRSKSYPVCNYFHEFTVDRPSSLLNDYDISYLGAGGFRRAWVFQQAGAEQSNAFVLKRLKMDQQINADHLIQIQTAAVIMERLTASSRIVDMYGYCGSSLMMERMIAGGASLVFQGDSLFRASKFDNRDKRFIRQSTLDKIQDKANDVVPMNNLTAVEKLDMAIAMAESIADLHGYKGGVMAHGDLKPDQWLLSSEGELKLNDFNHGEIFDYNPETSEYCRIERRYAGTVYMPPEQLRRRPENEGMDTYAMGCTIYSLMTGLSPFYQYGKRGRHDAQDEVKNPKVRKRPFVDKRYHNRSMIESNFVRIMKRCWEWDFEKRFSIFEVVKMLHKVKEDSERKAGVGSARLR